MSIYKLKIRYNGSGYSGWQIQEKPIKTIQGELNSALEKISKSKEVKSIGSGRTDTGVHALSQVAKIEIPIKLEPVSLQKALNSNLPDKIEILSVEESNEDFHPVRDAKKKEYRYYFISNKDKRPFTNEIISRCKMDLDFELMNEACNAFIGEHDFKNYFCTGTEVNSTVRTIFECEMREVRSNNFMGAVSGDYIEFRVVGSGFLKQMVRLIVGAIWAVGAGKKELLDLHESLSIRGNEKVGPTAPPEGLYLYDVEY